MKRWAILMVMVAASVGGHGAAIADRVRPGPCVRIDGGLVLGVPTTLPTGLSVGVGAGIGARINDVLWWGARAAVARATYYAATDRLTDTDARLRGTVTLGHAIGRGTVGLRLAAGGTVIHEHAKPMQSGRPDAVTWQIVPAADLEATIAVSLFGAWGLMMTGGPSLSLDDGAIDGGWVASVGVTWQR